MARCLDPFDSLCVCTDIYNPDTCTVIPECTDPAIPSCVCVDDNDPATCEFALSCRDESDPQCVCTDLQDPTTCVVAEAEKGYVGQQGLRRWTFNNTSAINMDNYRDSYASGVESLWTVAEIAYQNFEVKSTDILQGYFRAPATGQYRFLMSC